MHGRGFLLVVLIGLVGFWLPVRAEKVVPGKFTGFVCKDRWDQQLFFNGPRVFFLNKEAAMLLDSVPIGTSIEAEVTDLAQAPDTGTVLLKKVRTAQPADLGKSELLLSGGIAEEQVEQGKGVQLRIAVSNSSKGDAVLDLKSLVVVLMTKTPLTNQQMGYTDPQNRPFWTYQYAYPLSDTERLSLATRAVTPAWPVETALKSKGITAAEDPQGKPLPGMVNMASKAMFVLETPIGKELPPGEYQLFCYIHNPQRNSSCSPITEMLSFDVEKKGE